VKPIEDAPTPSANGVAALVFARLGELTSAPEWRDRAVQTLRAFAARAPELGLHGATYLSAVDRVLGLPAHLVVVGPPEDRAANEMHAEALRTYLPRRSVQRVVGPAGKGLPAAVLGMLDRGVVPAGYACHGLACSAPASDAAAWRETLLSLAASVRLGAL
jgi:uncharacterized protein YyaL (SSP411 family)